jgi:hypothetical protein
VPSAEPAGVEGGAAGPDDDGAETAVYVIDLVAAGEEGARAMLAALRPLLEDARLTKALHGAGPAARALWACAGARLGGVVDTQALQGFALLAGADVPAVDAGGGGGPLAKAGLPQLLAAHGYRCADSGDAVRHLPSLAARLTAALRAAGGLERLLCSAYAAEAADSGAAGGRAHAPAASVALAASAEAARGWRGGWLTEFLVGGALRMAASGSGGDGSAPPSPSK